MVRAGDGQEGLVGGAAGVVEVLSVGKGDDVVAFGVDDEGGAGRVADLVDIAEAFVFGKPDPVHVDPQQAQQGRGVGETAFDNEPRKGVWVGGGQFDGRGAAQRPAHEDEGAGVMIVRPPAPDIVEDGVAIPHHGGDGGGPGGSAVSPVIDGQQPDAHLSVNGREVVVIGDDLAVAVEIEDVGRAGVGGVEPGVDGDVFLDGDHHVRGVRGAGAGVGPGMEKESGHLRPVESRKGDVGFVGHGRSFLPHYAPNRCLSVRREGGFLVESEAPGLSHSAMLCPGRSDVDRAFRKRARPDQRRRTPGAFSRS